MRVAPPTTAGRVAVSTSSTASAAAGPADPASLSASTTRVPMARSAASSRATPGRVRSRRAAPHARSTVRRTACGAFAAVRADSPSTSAAWAGADRGDRERPGVEHRWVPCARCCRRRSREQPRWPLPQQIRMVPQQHRPSRRAFRPPQEPAPAVCSAWNVPTGHDRSHNGPTAAERGRRAASPYPPKPADGRTDTRRRRPPAPSVRAARARTGNSQRGRGPAGAAAGRQMVAVR